MNLLAGNGFDFLLYIFYYLIQKVLLINTFIEIYISLIKITKFLITKEGDIFER